MAARYGKLPFDDSPRVRVFRAIDDLLRAAPALKNVLTKQGAFRSWQGKPEDKSEFGQTQGVAVRIAFSSEPEEYWFPGNTRGWMVVQIEAQVPGLIIDDVDNLWYAIVQALGPLGNQARCLEIMNKLKSAGAVTGLIHFAQPIIDTSADAGSDGQFKALGALRIEVETS